ncbi:MAG: hypothetical protein LBU98_00975 [Alistipes sp.]|nr:hypothetical protein [Alistipes sp.]
MVIGSGVSELSERTKQFGLGVSELSERAKSVAMVVAELSERAERFGLTGFPPHDKATLKQPLTQTDYENVKEPDADLSPFG